jgi:hypothetical protein
MIAAGNQRRRDLRPLQDDAGGRLVGGQSERGVEQGL